MYPRAEICKLAREHGWQPHIFLDDPAFDAYTRAGRRIEIRWSHVELAMPIVFDGTFAPHQHADSVTIDEKNFSDTREALRVLVPDALRQR